MRGFKLVTFLFGAVLTLTAQGLVPNQIDCKDHGKILHENNTQALQWKISQPSGYHDRALISGTVDFIFPDRNGHKHFSVKIGPHNDDRIEVVYNESFGRMPQPKVGDTAEACGDYIVATKQNGSNPPSPDGAIVHWVHKNPNGGGHEDGFVILNGVLYGFN